MELLTPAVGLLFWMALVFGILVLLLKKFAWKPILSALKEREDSIESALRMAEETRAEMAKLKADNDKILAEARAERDKMIRDGKDVADKLIAEAKDRAVAEGNKIIADAREAIQQEKTAMIAQMKKDLATFSIEIAEKVLRKELADKKSQEDLVSSLISEANLN
ncbi:ATP synthase subunit b [Emticicia oligotrophica DSM 17448]|uniref:ATP synthase subunit b n=1 Tax=Emticicia oligotrophica (strain DSM 17448 / CIP 109782 / MTCC 6937 / GPTSA100-15) TaxID=929562 RepID=A0ABM5N7F6_EMTOG|nr:F0F1 ATP synthase subunit B [Emticicia oligotrophica]AFK05433.1 ATP synthase subunit b [Emticicia oligotrophica DSM 17448]